MAVYNENQMNRMKQDAIRRSQEMHRKPAGSLPSYRDEPGVGMMGYKGRNVSSGPQQEKSGINGIIDSILGDGIDDDKLLIAALLYLLIKEGADIKLIIALGYILL